MASRHMQTVERAPRLNVASPRVISYWTPWHRNLEAVEAHWAEVKKSSGGPGTGELMLIDARMTQLGLMARLEIESFYLLAGVLLERVATALGFYFEGRTESDWRHSGMTSKSFDRYA